MRFLLRSMASVWLLATAIAAERAAALAPAPPVLRLMHGDNPRWAEPGWDDRDWPAVNPNRLPGHAGIYWVRLHVTRPDRSLQLLPRIAPSWMPDQEGRPVNAVAAAFAGSSELYWDGRLLWRNGRIGADRASEAAGGVDVWAMIPGELLGPGEHVVALRISTHRYNFPGPPDVVIFFHLLNYDARQALNQKLATFPLIAVGCALVFALICAVLYWLVERSRALALGGACSVIVAVYYVVASWRALSASLLAPVPYDLLYPLTESVKVLMAVIGGLVLAMFLEQFSVPGKRWWFAVLAVMFAVVWVVTRTGRIGDASSSYWNPLWECRAALAMTGARPPGPRGGSNQAHGWCSESAQ